MKLNALPLCLSVYILFLLDQFTKWLVIENLFTKNGKEFLPWLVSLSQERLEFNAYEVTGFFNVVMVWNKGVSFGMFANHSTWSVTLLSGFALLMASIFAVWFFRSSSKLIRAASILIISGALGNVWDRVRFGAVADFLDFHAFEWHYPAFNLADSCIVTGVGVLLFKTLFIDAKEKDGAK